MQMEAGTIQGERSLAWSHPDCLTCRNTPACIAVSFIWKDIRRASETARSRTFSIVACHPRGKGVNLCPPHALSPWDSGSIPYTTHEGITAEIIKCTSYDIGTFQFPKSCESLLKMHSFLCSCPRWFTIIQPKTTLLWDPLNSGVL